MNEILKLGLVELCEALQARRLSPVELMEASLERIEQKNPELNAVVELHPREKLLAEAREAERRIAAGEARALEGIPLGVKDLHDAEGLINTQGSLIHKDRRSEQDCVEVARLRAAGAIVVGKTNSPEFGYTAITKNLVYGVTRNPWNPELTPGGSSGGASAALASHMLPLVTASDGGGSIRIPASFTGAFGLKPSYGRVPFGPMDHWVYDDTACKGPLTKTVEDAALMLDQTAGPSPHDPTSLPPPGVSYLEAVRGEPLENLRIAYSPDLGYANVQSDIAEIVYDSARLLEKLGHSVEQIQGGPPRLGREWGRLGALEKLAELRDYLPEREGEFGRSFIGGVKTGSSLTAEDFGEGKQQRMQLNSWCTGIFDRYDFLVTPTMCFDPPPAKGPFPAETEGKAQFAWAIAAFTIPFNLSLHPAATVRAGLSRAGLPVGMQIVGPRHREDRVLRLARAFERERPWHPNWPMD